MTSVLFILVLVALLGLRLWAGLTYLKALENDPELSAYMTRHHGAMYC